MKAERRARIDHEIQREMARLISVELKDPRLGFVTVTRVEITQDLQHAKIFVSIIGDRHSAKQSCLRSSRLRGFCAGNSGTLLLCGIRPSFRSSRIGRRSGLSS